MRDTLALSGKVGLEIVPALIGDSKALQLVDRTADVILMSREAFVAGIDATLSKPGRIRQWSYDFDPSGLELLRRAIDHVAGARRREPVGTLPPPDDRWRSDWRAMLRRCASPATSGHSTCAASRANGTRSTCR